MKLTITEFRKRFPDEDTCLDYLFNLQYSKLKACTSCGCIAAFARVKERRAYQCSQCSFQLYPTAGTVFHKTTTPLTYWFYAIYLFTTTRNGVAAKELERQLDVCYKTALRMAHQIKKLMADTSDAKLVGEVLADETYLGQKATNMHNKKRKKLEGTGGANKIAVFGMMEKDGRIITKVLPTSNVNGMVLKPIIRNHIDKSAVIVTDGHGSYKDLHLEFKQHEIVMHNQGEYVKDGGFTTNNIENYWSTLKRMIKGTHIHVSREHLPKYIAENSFRYMNRKHPEQMFDIILSQIA